MEEADFFSTIVIEIADMNNHSTLFDTIINISAYKVLHRLLQNQPDLVFRLTDQELDDIIKYDILNIMASYRNMMSPSQKNYVVELLESEMRFGNIPGVLDDLSDSTKDEVYIPYLLKLVNRINIHPVVTAAYQVLFKYFTNLMMLGSKAPSFVA